MSPHGIRLDAPEIRAFCSRWNIRELSVFGSVLRDDFRPDSDVDFLADFDEDDGWDLIDEVHMRQELERIVGRKVDLLTRYALDTDCSASFRESVLARVERIHAR